MSFDGQGMDFTSHTLAQGAIDALVARNWTLPGNLSYDQRLKMRLILRAYLDTCARQRGADQFGDLFRMHGLPNLIFRVRAYQKGSPAPIIN